MKEQTGQVRKENLLSSNFFLKSVWHFLLLMLLAKSIVCESDGSLWKMNISLRNKTLYLLVYGTLKKSNGMNCQLDCVGFYCDSLPNSLTTPID